MEWEILETPWLLFVDNRDKNTINKFSILYYLFFKISVQIYMSIFNGQTLGVGMGGGGVYCVPPTTVGLTALRRLFD